ncbi:MAG: hypothetical protein LBH64_01630, partial [Coriobacteriales bacterium]|nr:hypothetical protein [Coriobacteriales bacterium]
VIARVADAVVLSLSLFGMLVFGISIVVSCIPSCQGIGVKLMDFGHSLFDARDTCARQATHALDRLQRALPFLAVANAAAAIEANSPSPSSGAHYHGLAILVPLTGEETVFPDDDEARDAAASLDEQNAETSEAAKEAEEAREEMDEAKREAYLADCGASPNYCMHERAERLAGLSGVQNPQFSSVELWRFDYAFERAKSYYQRRLAIEAPANQSLKERVRSLARRMFYSYAVEEMDKGYANTDADGVLDAYFPLLARNNAEVRETHLYTDRVFPVDSKGTLHAFSSCPGFVKEVAGMGSLADLEAGSYTACAQCELSLSTIGRVASASTSIDNGFEYHYRIVAAAAERYETASKRYQETTEAARESADDAFDSFEEALAALDSPRLSPHPPGRSGCVALAIDASTREAAPQIAGGLSGGAAVLQPRIALSAAALADDAADENGNLISSVLEKAAADADWDGVFGRTLGLFDGVFDLWGSALSFYNGGVSSLVGGVGGLLRSIPLVNATPLASWAEDALGEAIEAVGLQEIDIDTPKPLLVNSMHVLRRSNSVGAAGLVHAKEALSALPAGRGRSLATDPIGSLLEDLRAQGITRLEGEFTLFTISFGDAPGMPQIPITVKLPSALARTGRGLLDSLLSLMPTAIGGEGGYEVWE